MNSYDFSGFVRAMCSPYSLGARTPSPEIPLLNWLDTAICCFAHCYRHRADKYIICNECFAEQSVSDRRFYDSVERHYVHIGIQEELEECSICNNLTTRRQIPSACPTCYHVVQDFAAYLRESGDTPYESDASTIIVVSETLDNRDFTF